MDLGLTGVPSVVAAASRGLGYAVAKELAAEGGQVAICSRDAGSARGAATSIQGSTGAEVHGIEADVSKPEGAQRFIDDAVSLMGGIQVLVTNAGGPPPGGPLQFNDQEWTEALELNFLSTVRMIRAAVPHMEKKPWARIVCITSALVKEPSATIALSSASRAAVTGFAKTLAAEVGSNGITVNCVMPENILTDRVRQIYGAPDDAGPDHPAFKELVNRVPLGRMGTPQEFAAVVAFLCSERASYLNGTAITVDGGASRGLL